VEQLLKVGQQHVKGMVDMLGDGPDVGRNSHEIMVTLPAGYHMKMKMIGYSGAGGFSQIESDINPVGVEVIPQNPAALLENQHKCTIFLLTQLSNVADVSGRACEQVTVSVGKTIEQNDAA